MFTQPSSPKQNPKAPMEPVAVSVLPAAGPFKVRGLRWYICVLLASASSINYIDRQTVAILKPYLQQALHWTESDYGWMIFAFQVSYGIMLIASGDLIDRLGTRLGFAISITLWSLAAAAHALCRKASSFGVARFLLGAGEAGNNPATIKGIAEWFPIQERSLAAGVFCVGTNVGVIVAPPLVVWLTVKLNWQAAFILTGSLGFSWLIIWLLIYRLPERHPWIADSELKHILRGRPEGAERSELKTSWREILSHTPAWGFVLGKFLTDPVWWFYVFWLPSYLKQERGFSLAMIGYFAWIPFLAANIGSLFGGWLPGFLMKRGWDLNRARKTAMMVCAFSMPAAILAAWAPSAWMALALISVATSGHQGWSSNLLTLASDIFPQKDTASVTGLGGAGGSIGGMILAPTVGYLLQGTGSYTILFIAMGLLHPLAMGVVHLFIPKIQPFTKA